MNKRNGLRELSLFSGSGGGILGTKLLGFRAIGYVEVNRYCQSVIRKRIDEGHTDDAPIFSDIRAFIAHGYAKRYRGVAEVVTAGFPCQPFSVLGNMRASKDARNLWPETAEVLRLVRPRFALLENVPGLRATGYLATVLRDLLEIGFDAEWDVFSAAGVGAPHLRRRLFILAHSHRERRTPIPQGGRPGTHGAWLPNAGGRRWWNAEPKVGRVDDGVAHRVDRVRSLGNGQVPAVVATAWHELMRRVVR